MIDQDTQLYNLLFTGRLEAGCSHDTCQTELLKIITVNERTLSLIYSGRPVLLKGDIGSIYGERLCQRLQRIGIICELVPSKKIASHKKIQQQKAQNTQQKAHQAYIARMSAIRAFMTSHRVDPEETFPHIVATPGLYKESKRQLQNMLPPQPEKKWEKTPFFSWILMLIVSIATVFPAIFLSLSITYFRIVPGFGTFHQFMTSYTGNVKSWSDFAWAMLIEVPFNLVLYLFEFLCQGIPFLISGTIFVLVYGVIGVLPAVIITKVGLLSNNANPTPPRLLSLIMVVGAFTLLLLNIPMHRFASFWGSNNFFAYFTFSSIGSAFWIMIGIGIAAGCAYWIPVWILKRLCPHCQRKLRLKSHTVFTLGRLKASIYALKEKNISALQHLWGAHTDKFVHNGRGEVWQCPTCQRGILYLYVETRFHIKESTEIFPHRQAKWLVASENLEKEDLAPLKTLTFKKVRDRRT